MTLDDTFWKGEGKLIRIISQNGLIKAELNCDSNAVDDVFRFGSDIMGVYYDLDSNPKMCVLARYTSPDLALTSLDDFLDWRANYSDEEPIYRFMSEEECVAVDTALIEDLNKTIYNTYKQNN